MSEEKDNSGFNVDNFLKGIFPKAEETKDPQKSVHDGVSVDEKDVPKAKNEDQIKEGSTEKKNPTEKMFEEFNAITEENFNDKILDFQIFLSSHNGMLDKFKPELFGLIKEGEGESSRISRDMRKKRIDDSLIFKGEMESLELELHKVGKKLRFLKKIRDSLF